MRGVQKERFHSFQEYISLLMGSFVCSCKVDFFFLNQDHDVEEQSAECLDWFYVTAELL